MIDTISSVFGDPVRQLAGFSVLSEAPRPVAQDASNAA
jgi:hypothetical protein